MHLCEEESFLFEEFPEILHKYRKSGGLEKKLLKSILENIALKNAEDQALVVRKLVHAEGVEI